jgi:hypothetical protein
MKNAFKEGTPESVGISSEAIEWLLDELESGFTEPHGLMIMRNNVLCAKGAWNPFALGIRHGLQSHSKTYAATAIGIAYTEGILKLDEKLIDIFPEEAPSHPSENLQNLTVRDTLCMGNGMEEESPISENWIRDFLATPVVHAPGTAFMYNSTGSSILAAIIRKKTGMGLEEFLTPRLYEKIGIDYQNHAWIKAPDGTELGGAGMFASIEDNFRLMKLYMDDGIWNGERILASDYVREATSKIIDTSSEQKVNPPASDNFLGYGYQIWQCKPEGAYRADGAMGQFTIVIPDKKMEIAVTENASGAHWAQRTLDIIWEFLDKVVSDQPLPEDPEKSGKLMARLQRLSLPQPLYKPDSIKKSAIDQVTFEFPNPLRLDIFGLARDLSSKTAEIPVYTMKIVFHPTWADLYFDCGRKYYHILTALDGTRRRNSFDGDVVTQVIASGYWRTEDCFEVKLRWIETCGEETLSIHLLEDGNILADLTGTIAFHDDQKSIQGKRLW